MEADIVESKYQNKVITIPNILSFLRLLLIPLIVWLYVVQKNPLWTALVLTLSGITDIADGIIARRFHMVSDFGKALDPVADKLTQIAMLFCLFTRFRWMLLPLCLLVVKEITAGIMGMMVIRKTGKVEGAVWHGKVPTVLVYGMMAIHLVLYSIPPVVSDLLIVGSTAMALLSAVLYAVKNIRILKGSSDF